MAVLAFAGCQKNLSATDAEIPCQQEQTMVFSATTDVQTKTTLSPSDDVYNVIWQEGDQIRINGYLFNLSADQPEGWGPGYTRADFTGSVVASATTFEAWYPISLSTAWYYKKTLPATQTYAEDNVIGFPMYAIGENENLQFKSLCGIIRLNLKGTKSVSSIGLKDRSDSPKGLSGDFNVNDYNAVVNGTAGVLLECGTPVVLSADEFTSFMIAVPAGSYGKLQITVSATDGTAAILTSNKAITVERSVITDINISSPQFKAPGDEITYTTRIATPLDKYAVGADASVFGENLTVVGHSYDSATKTGVITLSGTATQVGQNAFASSELVTITLPDNIETFGRECFYNCRSLTTVNKPSKLKTIEYRAFCNAMAFTGIDISGITAIGADAFAGSAFTGDIVIDSELTEIGAYAFRSCKTMTAVFNAMPATVGNCLFESSGITSVTFNCNVGDLAGWMFNGCRSLTSATFKGTLGSIGASAFYGCSALESISLPSTCKSIGNDAFTSCTKLASFIMPADLTKLGTNAFGNCTSLESITFSEGIATIPANAFQTCSALVNVTIPDSVNTIDSYSFNHCKALKTVTIGTGIEKIYQGSFNDTALETLTITRTTYVPWLQNNSNCFPATTAIHVPAALVESYKAADKWSTYADNISAIE